MKKTFLISASLILAAIGISTKANAFNFSHDFASVYLGSYQDSFIHVATEAEGTQAKAMIDKMGQRAVDFLSNPSLSQSQKEAQFRRLLNDHFDMPTIGRFTLGNNWKNATPAQQNEYQKLFKNLVVKVYAGRFNDYQGQGFDIQAYRDSGKRDIMVTSYIVPDNGSKVQIDWRVRNKDGEYKVIDVIIEGVSMTLTQRADFNSVIQRGGGNMEALLEHLRK